ncbi:MAG: RNA 2',3'-cyclic phosphodiesterase [Candidatus Omnitrophota bacterium]|jgi:2'-5' RNA ligase
MGGLIRAFIAIELSDEAKAEAYAEACASAQAVARAGVKWVSEDNIHLTLRFLGDTDEETLSRAASVLAGIAAGSGPFSIRLKGLGAFPQGISSPTVVWAGLSEGATESAQLSESIGSSLVDLGIPKEGRHFTPHVTLGRVRSGKNAYKLRKAIESSTFTASSITIADHITLFRSVLAPGGPVYTPISIARLSQPGQ